MGTFSGMRGGKKDPCQDGGRLLPPLWVPHCRRDPPTNCCPFSTGRERCYGPPLAMPVPTSAGPGGGFWPWIPGTGQGLNIPQVL